MSWRKCLDALRDFDREPPWMFRFILGLLIYLGVILTILLAAHLH